MFKSKGFTLIELMLVSAIIGMLVALALPKFANLIRKAKEAITRGNLGALRSAMTIYYADTEGGFPETLQALTIGGKYIDDLPSHWTYDHDQGANWVGTFINGDFVALSE